MMKKNWSLLDVAPKYWGVIYIALIPVFAIIYCLLPDNSITNLQHGENIGDFLFRCLYFSTVTITTLGYGDLSPATISAQVLVMAETILGMVIIGFFLNSVAFLKSQIDANAEKERMEEENIKQEKLST